MEETPADINRIIEALGNLIDDFSRFWDENGNPDPESGNSPAVIIETLVNLLEMLYAHETGVHPIGEGATGTSLSRAPRLDPIGEGELNELGNYGLSLLDSLEIDTGSINYPSHQSFGDLAFPLALWLARNDGEIEELGPVVNALARTANRLSHPEELEGLFSQSSEILHAVSPILIQDPEQHTDGAPWAMMLFNRGIIATRSTIPELIEAAYKELVEQLPLGASDFFCEATEQMELLAYPSHVRAIVERYYNEWGVKKLLH
ncbi:MAG: hypothetical protein A2286_14380 [Gammaproteobacteria bacterium RIFOXYA12_FULL_61_12]|nr:MAG: hypothetical protein A2286_14380 [Gammaproteobacteria bacterium RIFOXYA12_FULL_61_12]OGT89645.1 MAG: hypothetical protein A2514_14720 [Gammaproteobacteria bacterium RIFOXYD12_FULL_61_37]